jgi:LCP family protein required for cell wall assembly
LPPPTRPRKRRHPIRAFFVTVFLLLLAWIAVIVAIPLITWTRLSVIDDLPQVRPAEQPGTAILLVGSDSRTDLTAEEKVELATGDADGDRTDTMLIYYAPPTGRPALVSLPRDSYLPIPGYWEDKLNAAYSYGGAPLLIETVEQNTGVQLDGYLEINMLGFSNLVDAVDGVEICPPEAIVDVNSNLDLAPGCQTIDGPTALGYVRMRMADPRGDLGRVERQREIITKVAAKLLRPSTVLNPIRWWDVNSALTTAIRRGSDTTMSDLLAAARSGPQFIRGDAVELTVPIADSDAYTDAGSSVLWDDDLAAQMFAEIAAGDTSGLDRFKQ